MKLTELIEILTPALKMLSRHGVFMDDWKYVEVVERYKRMRSLGVKQQEAVRILSEETKVSRRTIERAVKRLGREC